MQPPNEVAVIIPVHNGMQDLPACLAALSKQRDIAFDIFAVDVASVDGSAQYIQTEWPTVCLMCSPESAGLVHACNLALSAATDYSVIVLLRQDTEVLPDWLVHLVAPLRNNPSIGIAGSKILFPNGTIEQAGGRIDSRGIGRPIGHGQPDRGQHDAPRKVEYVSDVSLAISRQAYQAVRALDEGLSPAVYTDTNWADIDWCSRVRSAGYHVVYTPKSRLIRRTADARADAGTSATGDTNADDGPGDFSFHRNRLRFILKHWSLHRLVDDFMPAEQRWLGALGAHRRQFNDALHRAYLHQLVHLDEIVDAREEAFATDSEELHGLAAVLLSLRTLYPAYDELAAGEIAQPQPLAAATAAPQGALAHMSGGVRQVWTRIALSRPLSPVSRPLMRMSNQQQLAETLLTYVHETHRELAELAQTTQAQGISPRQRPRTHE